MAGGVVREPLECLSDGCGLSSHELPAGLAIDNDKFDAHFERLGRPPSTPLRGGNVVVDGWTRTPIVFSHGLAFAGRSRVVQSNDRSVWKATSGRLV